MGYYGIIRGMFPMKPEVIFPNKIPLIFVKHYYEDMKRVVLESSTRTNEFLL